MRTRFRILLHDRLWDDVQVPRLLLLFLMLLLLMFLRFKLLILLWLLMNDEDSCQRTDNTDSYRDFDVAQFKSTQLLHLLTNESSKMMFVFTLKKDKYNGK